MPLDNESEGVRLAGATQATIRDLFAVGKPFNEP